MQAYLDPGVDECLHLGDLCRRHCTGQVEVKAQPLITHLHAGLCDVLMHCCICFTVNRLLYAGAAGCCGKVRAPTCTMYVQAPLSLTSAVHL